MGSRAFLARSREGRQSEPMLERYFHLRHFFWNIAACDWLPFLVCPSISVKDTPPSILQSSWTVFAPFYLPYTRAYPLMGPTYLLKIPRPPHQTVIVLLTPPSDPEKARCGWRMS